MEGEQSSDDADDSLSENSEEMSVNDGANDDKVVNHMFDEYEEGEVRPPEPNQPVPAVASHQSPESQPNLECEEPLEDVRLVNGESVHVLHGEHSIPKEPFNTNKVNNVGTEELAAGNSNGGSQCQDVREDPIVDPMHQDGPTPSVGLGKRSRAHRSPPSSGSMQGPPTRSFYQNSDNEDFSFDLNRPSAETTSVFSRCIGGIRV
ncbi:hypothetical protein Hanom_Chr16g01507741 [Helianthus anomalus]